LRPASPAVCGGEYDKDEVPPVFGRDELPMKGRVAAIHFPLYPFFLAATGGFDISLHQSIREY
jgi:hypothetical protein